MSNIDFEYEGIKAANVVRLKTPSGNERTVRVTGSSAKGGRVLLDFGAYGGDSKIIVGLDNLDDFITALSVIADEVEAAA